MLKRNVGRPRIEEDVQDTLIAVRVTARLRQAVRVRSEETGVSISTVLRSAMVSWVSEPKN